MEICKMPGNRKLPVYADTETFYVTHGLEPWTKEGTKEYGKTLAHMEVYPLILVWMFKKHSPRFRKGEGYYESGGWIKRNYLNDGLDRIEELLLDLSFIYNEWGMTPVLYFHNASYDIPVLAPLFEKLDPDLTLYFYTGAESKKNFMSGSMMSKKYNFYCEFGDTLKYDSRMSIEKAGKIFGKPKIVGVPYELCDVSYEEDGNIYYIELTTGKGNCYPLKQYMEYAMRDVEIMAMLHERNLKNINMVNQIMMDDWEKMDKEYFLRSCQTRPGHSKSIANKYLKDQG